ncbi:LOW QUALITY PROTEIN: hypothetical protein M513_13937, partial [Trichuris suis]
GRAKKKCRQYNVEYLRYGFIPSPSNPQQPFCLICEKAFANELVKPSKLVKHLKTMHGDKANKDLSYFQSITFKSGLNCQGFFHPHQEETPTGDGLRASYNISLLMAKCGKPHAIGEELILPAVSEVLRTVVRMPATEIIKRIPLSNNTELLFAKELLTDTRGESIFHTVEDFFKENEIALTNVIAVATDGAPSMLARHRGFLSYLKEKVPDLLAVHCGSFKEKVPDLLAVHCVIHRQHLEAKRLSDRVIDSLQYVIT